MSFVIKKEKKKPTQLFCEGFLVFISRVYLNKITCDCRANFKQTLRGRVAPCPGPPSRSWMKGRCVSRGPFPAALFHPLLPEPKTTKPARGKPFVSLACFPLITVKLCVPDKILHGSTVNSRPRGQCFLGRGA